MNARESAVRYFRGWLTAAVATSILGNVAHAVLNPAAESRFIAAAVAFLLPLGILGSTHGVHKLVAAGIVGRAYTAALSISVAVVVAAFALSFVALAELAVDWAGISIWIAWLVPVFIDLSIAGCTVALFALSDAERVEYTSMRDRTHAVADTLHATVHPPAHVDAQPADLRKPAAIQPPAARLTVADLMARTKQEHTAAQHIAEVHHNEAERIVNAGVTRIDRGKVAQVLHEHAQNTAPSMIARKLNVGYPTVKGILQHATHQPEEVDA